jgi:hypothetical protein
MNRFFRYGPASLTFIAAAWCIGFSGNHAKAESLQSPAKLSITNLPADVKVLINNSAIRPDENNRYLVQPGPIGVQIESKGIVSYSASLILKAGEERTIILTCREQCATLDIVTDPFGASVYLNGQFEGLTPYVNSFMKPGDYDLDVSMHGYEPVMRGISIVGTKPIVLTLNLEQTQAFRDSIKTIKLAQKRSRQLVQKMLFSGLAAFCGAGGAYFDLTAKSKLSQADDAALAYDRAHGDFQQYHDGYNANRDAARKAMGNRDILYIAAGACTVGLAFSFLF